jgi:hypothetical protein
LAAYRKIHYQYQLQSIESRKCEDQDEESRRASIDSRVEVSCSHFYLAPQGRSILWRLLRLDCDAGNLSRLFASNWSFGELHSSQQDLTRTISVIPDPFRVSSAPVSGDFPRQVVVWRPPELPTRSEEHWWKCPSRGIDSRKLTNQSSATVASETQTPSCWEAESGYEPPQNQGRWRSSATNNRRQKRLRAVGESARLSRRRHKQYLEVLEEKVTSWAKMDQGRREHV